MEKLLFVSILLSVLFIALKQGPETAFSLAFAGAQNPLDKFLHSATSLVFFTAEEAKKQIEDIGNGLKGLVQKAQDEVKELREKSAPKEDVEALKKEYQEKFDKYAEKNDKHMDELQKQADELATKMKKSGGEDKNKSFSEQVNDQLTAKEADLKAIKEQKGNINFNVKAVGTQLIANYNSGTGIALTSWDNEMSRAPKLAPFMRELVRTRGIGSMYVAWAEVTGGEGAADTVAEGVKKPQKDFDFVEASKKVEKIAVFTKASKEALDDIPFLRGEINNGLVDDIELELDDQILNGNGTTPNLKGINSYASAISVVGLPFATGISDPNNADVLMVAAAVVANSGFQANYAIINPLDAAMMQLTKDANGNYVLPPFSTANGLQIAGLRVIPKRQVTQGSFLVGDFNRDILAIREEINIQIGYENDDFTKNLITILAEMRAVNYIKAQHVNAFTKGSFATVRTAIAAA